MARRVRSPLAVGGMYKLPAIPALESEISDRYQHIFRKRWDMFPSNEPEVISVDGKMLDYSEHSLRYEAESLFWNLVYWSMTAQPDTPPADIQSTIAQGFRVTLLPRLWEQLVSTGDGRDMSFISCRYLEKGCLHPSYSPLYTLLDAVRRHFQADPELSKDKLKHHDEYFHEVFQRLIINFLVENASERFMDLKRSETLRGVDKPGMRGSSTPAPTLDNLSGSSARVKRSAQKRAAEDADTGVEPVSNRYYPLMMLVAYVHILRRRKNNHAQSRLSQDFELWFSLHYYLLKLPENHSFFKSRCFWPSLMFDGFGIEA